MPVVREMHLYFDFVSSPWHTAPKTFGISAVMRMLFCMLIVTGSWDPYIGSG